MKLGKKIIAIAAVTLASIAAFPKAAYAGGGGGNEGSLQALLLIIQTSQSEAERARAYQQLNEQYNPYRDPPPSGGPPPPPR
ncbi:hypothetical protein KA183_03830 [bacterium]|nr:hypothetical protein [bacterium]QQR59773.1 MAG: hypothetical protein IPG59_09885 [Candidatus Melainabacteria bacterium]